MNEATLEAKVHALFLKVFPNLNAVKMTHQKTFNLILGHHEVSIDTEKQFKKGGRLDILISYEDKPLAVVELKRPSEELTPRDAKQGLSYARLLEEMAPLVIVTNGENTKYYTTYNMQEWFPETIDEETLQNMFRQILEMSTNDKDKATRFLLSTNEGIWEEVISQISTRNLKSKLGDPQDFSKPVMGQFQIPRLATEKIKEMLLSNKPLITLVGNPLSGKTNVLNELCNSKEDHYVPLYIDLSSPIEGIMQTIANEFTRKLFISSSVDEIRQWLISNALNRENKRLVLLLDGYSYDPNREFQKELNELHTINEDGKFSIVVATDENGFNRLKNVEGRRDVTPFGCGTELIKLDKLSDKEFSNVIGKFREEFNIIFYPGVDENVEYRNPGFLRLLFAYVLESDSLNGSKKAVPGVLEYRVLESTWKNYINDYILKDDLDLLAQAVIKANNQQLDVVKYGYGSISLRTAERVLGKGRLERLGHQGFISMGEDSDNSIIILQKSPEFLAAAAAFYLAKESKSIEDIIQYSSLFQYEDMVASLALSKISQDQPELFKDHVDYLLKCPPFISTSESNKNEPIKQTGSISIFQYESYEETPLGKLQNTLPWLILSRLLCDDLIKRMYSLEEYLEMLYKVGAFSNILLNSIILHHFKGVMKGNGEHLFISSSSGIIEPITHAIQRAFCNFPEEMLEFSKKAIENQEFFLIYRLLIAVRSLTGISDYTISSYAKKAFAILKSVNSIHSD